MISQNLIHAIQSDINQLNQLFTAAASTFTEALQTDWGKMYYQRYQDGMDRTALQEELSLSSGYLMLVEENDVTVLAEITEKNLSLKNFLESNAQDEYSDEPYDLIKTDDKHAAPLHQIILLDDLKSQLLYQLAEIQSTVQLNVEPNFSEFLRLCGELLKFNASITTDADRYHFFYDRIVSDFAELSLLEIVLDAFIVFPTQVKEAALLVAEGLKFIPPADLYVDVDYIALLEKTYLYDFCLAIQQIIESFPSQDRDWLNIKMTLLNALPAYFNEIMERFLCDELLSMHLDLQERTRPFCEVVCSLILCGLENRQLIQSINHFFHYISSEKLRIELDKEEYKGILQAFENLSGKLAAGDHVELAQLLDFLRNPGQPSKMATGQVLRRAVKRFCEESEDPDQPPIKQSRPFDPRSLYSKDHFFPQIPVNPTNTIVYSARMHDIDRHFTLIPIVGDGDCGFEALGCEREEIVDFLQALAEQKPQEKVHFFEEIMEIYVPKALEYKGQYEQLVQSSDKQQQLIGLWGIYDEKLAQLSELNRQSGIDASTNLDRIIALHNQGNSQLADQISDLVNEIDENLEQQKQLALSKELFDCYVNSFNPPQNRWLSCNAMMYFAKYYNQSICILHQKGDDPLKLELLHEFITEGVEPTYLFFRNGMHFDKLAPVHSPVTQHQLSSSEGKRHAGQALRENGGEARKSSLNVEKMSC